MRIVIDTSVLLSALLWRGTPHALLDHVRAGTLELMMSPALMDEMERVIRYPKFSDSLSRTTRTPDGTALYCHAATAASTRPDQTPCKEATTEKPSAVNRAASGCARPDSCAEKP